MADALYYMKGKGKKGKTASRVKLLAFQKGKSSKSGKGKKGSMSRPAVNAYPNELFSFEFSGALDVHSATSPGYMGLIDCGATASAGPQIAVEAHLDQGQSSVRGGIVYKNARPFFVSATVVGVVRFTKRRGSCRE